MKKRIDFNILIPIFTVIIWCIILYFTVRSVPKANDNKYYNSNEVTYNYELVEDNTYFVYNDYVKYYAIVNQQQNKIILLQNVKEIYYDDLQRFQD